MQTVNIIFFGSTDDSVIVLEKLCHVSGVMCQAVVTQPPRPVGRSQILTPTPVELWAKAHGLPVLSFPSDSQKPWLYADEEQVIDALEPLKADMIISACYGQRIPNKTITDARFGGLNVHPSLLPRWRGADPVPWAIFFGDHQTGVTVVTLSEQFDEGRIIVQKKIPITRTDTSDPLRTKLFVLGADLLVTALPDYLAHGKSVPHPSPAPISPTSYARRLKRDDGFEPWDELRSAFEYTTEAMRIDRKFRAFFPWPGVWTKIRMTNHESGISEEKRLKILSCHLDATSHSPVRPVMYRLVLDTVQLEGKKPVSWDQFSRAFFPLDSHVLPATLR